MANERSARRHFRRKHGLRFLPSLIVAEDDLIRLMLKTGWYCRPRTGAPTFEGACRAYERMLRALLATTVVTHDNKEMDSGDIAAVPNADPLLEIGNATA